MQPINEKMEIWMFYTAALLPRNLTSFKTLNMNVNQREKRQRINYGLPLSRGKFN